MNQSYHNTVGESLQMTIFFEDKAKDQELTCLRYFTRFGTLSPSQLYHCLINDQSIPKATPLTSIRRAVTNLTKKGLLVKTDHKVLGMFKRLEYTWKKAN